MISIFIIFAVFILFYINKMTNSLCLQKEIPEERQPKVFRTINILITILLISSFVEILYAQDILSALTMSKSGGKFPPLFIYTLISHIKAQQKQEAPMMINKMNSTTTNAKPPPHPCPPDIWLPPLKFRHRALSDPMPTQIYSHAQPTMINKINNTTINAKPPPYPAPMDNTSPSGCYHILFICLCCRIGFYPGYPNFFRLLETSHQRVPCIICTIVLNGMGEYPNFFKKQWFMNQALLSSFVIFFIYGIVENVINEGTVKAIAGF